MTDINNIEIQNTIVSIIDNDTANNNTITGMVWNDLNRNQVYDQSEIKLSNWEVYIDENSNLKFDIGEIKTSSNEDGYYYFYNIPTGEHNIRQIINDGYSQTTPRNEFENFHENKIYNNYNDSIVELDNNSLSENENLDYYNKILYDLYYLK